MKEARKSTPKEHNAIAFYATRFEHASGAALKFAGDDGRIATIPDIIDARLATSVDDGPWQQYFQTQSAEYVGSSQGGNPLLVVAHGVGPLATSEGTKAAYTSPNGHERRNGRVSRKEFKKLVDGDYGEVAIVDIKTLHDQLVEPYGFAFRKTYTKKQALEDPLVSARLGPKAEEYLEHFGDEAGRIADQKRIRMHLNSPILKMDAPGGYPFTPKMLQDKARYDQPFAHNLTISHFFEQSYIDCTEGLGGARVVGVATPDQITDIVPSTSLSKRFIADHLPQMLRPVTQDRYTRNFFNLLHAGDTWFTDYAREGEGVDKGEPEYVVTHVKPVAEQVVFRTNARGSYFFYYDPAEVHLIAPKEANAYHLGEDIETIDGENVVPVQFYRVNVDTSFYIPMQKELEEDYETVVYLATHGR